MANKNEMLIIRISEHDKKAAKEAAEKRQMSLSEWVLYLMRKELDK